jgi:hypothetical protein
MDEARTLMRAVMSWLASSSCATSRRIWRTCTSFRFRSSLIRATAIRSDVLLRTSPPIKPKKRSGR